MDGAQLEGVYGVAKGIYADMAQKQGLALGKDAPLNESIWNMSMHRALGGRYDASNNKWFGGVWSWGKSPVLIPNTITGKQFEGAMTWLGNARWQEGSKNYPVYENGVKMPNSALGQLIPVLRPDGFYEFHGPNGAIVHKKSGGNFTFDLESIAKRFQQ